MSKKKRDREERKEREREEEEEEEKEEEIEETEVDEKKKSAKSGKREPRAKYLGRISYAAVELCGRELCDMRGMGDIWLLASQEPGEVNEPPPGRVLFPSTAITHAESHCLIVAVIDVGLGRRLV